MQRFLLIGESGGSKTDWAYLRTNELPTLFSSTSLHPDQWVNTDFRDLKKQMDKEGVDLQKTSLIFFGAGCNAVEKQNLFQAHLSSFGFHTLEVFGDLKAAAVATLGKSDGYVAILGSGSVLIHYANEQVESYTGGLGRTMGDEGAGYFFGKLVLHAFMEKKLTALQVSILKSVLSFAEEKKLEKQEVAADLCLQLPLRLSENRYEFEAFHRANLSLFFEKYVNVPLGQKIHFVGSYAYFHQELLRQIATAEGYEMGEIIKRPIHKLVRHYQNIIDSNEH